MHLTTLFRTKGHREGEFPNAERIARETVALPMHAGMNEADVDRVCAALARLLGA
jgi:dTDP-4-amino-4,6-dideoxygalactose transaminase